MKSERGTGWFIQKSVILNLRGVLGNKNNKNRRLEELGMTREELITLLEACVDMERLIRNFEHVCRYSIIEEEYVALHQLHSMLQPYTIYKDKSEDDDESTIKYSEIIENPTLTTEQRWSLLGLEQNFKTQE